MIKNKKQNNWAIFSSIGGVFTLIGIVLMTVGSSKNLYLSCLILGVIFAGYGFALMRKSKNKIK